MGGGLAKFSPDGGTPQSPPGKNPAYITGMQNQWRIILLYRVGKKYTGWNIQKVTIFIGIMNSLLFFSYVDQNKCRFKKPLHRPSTKYRKEEFRILCIKDTGWSKFCLFFGVKYAYWSRLRFQILFLIVKPPLIIAMEFSHNQNIFNWFFWHSDVFWLYRVIKNIYSWIN